MRPLKTDIKKIGDSFYIHIPKMLLDMFEFIDLDYEWELHIIEDKKKIELKRGKKKVEEEKKKAEEYN